MYINNISTLDWAIITAWVTLTFGSVLIIRLKNFESLSSERNYILMGRKLTLPLFVATLVSSWYGGLFGVTQIAFEHGIYNFITQGLFWYAAYLLFAIFLVKRIHKENAITFPDLIQKIFGEKAAKFSAIALILKALPIAYALSLGAFIQILFGFSLQTSILVGTLLVTFYTALGNFKTIVYSDFIQFCVMYLGVVMVVLFSYYHIGSPIMLLEKLPEHYFQITGKHNYSTMLLWLFIAFTATLISPVFYQRCMSAKTPKVAHFGIMISTLFWLIFDICTTLGGMYAKVYMPDANSLNAYLQFGIAILPNGLKGLFLAACMATIISTLDSFIFASSTLLSHNLFPQRFRAYNVNRMISVFVVGLLSAIIALFFNDNIENIWIFAEGYFGALLIIPIIWSYFIRKKISDNAFIITALLSFIIMALKDLLVPEIGLESFYFGILATLVCYLFCIISRKNIYL